MRSLFTLLTLALLLIPGRAAAQDTTGLSSRDVSAIRAASDAFAKAVVARNTNGLAEFYTSDGALYPPGETMVKGRVAIEACLAALPPMKDFSLRILTMDGAGDVAYVQGTYTMTMTAPGAETAQASGYYVEIRRRQADGRWLIAVHMLTPHE
jgi:uncharacterized protein (TIGR02246 family)